MSNKLEQLKAMTDVVADTGDIEAIKLYQPLDATTNPSLVYKAAQMPQYQNLVASAIEQGEDPSDAADRLAVSLGKEITDIIPGRISTEVDARLSFDKEAMIHKAQQLIHYYQAVNVKKDRVLIKLASTWEGIQAAEYLERQGINCNLTLLFSFAQAQACADAGVTLISPFVGRILDWYKAANPEQQYTADNDPGVLSVREIFEHYKQHGYKTIVMGASFRNTGEIEGLAGCDRLTISPQLLDQLQNDHGQLSQQLDASRYQPNQAVAVMKESEFRYKQNQNAMATEKLAEGIRNFIIDQEKLEKLLVKP